MSTDGATEVLWNRPEACIAKVGDALVALYLTSIRNEWLPELRDVLLAAAEREGRPLPMIAIFRLDRRYPLEIGFDGRFEDIRNTLDASRSALTACSTVLEFGGWVRSAMVRVLTALGIGESSKPPFGVHSSCAEGIVWLAPHLSSRYPAGFYVDGIAALKREWGCVDV
ncbi:MAG: hypothetical protein KC657_32540 [Myxococcales bacterium]|nr:hypothetical protein [Myxococcales bacterium]